MISGEGHEMAAFYSAVRFTDLNHGEPVPAVGARGEALAFLILDLQLGLGFSQFRHSGIGHAGERENQQL